MERRDLKDIGRAVKSFFSINTVLVVLLTFAMHLSTIAAMTSIALAMDGTLPPLRLFGGFSLVVLATALPIGFGGWGIREASAAGVFSYAGLPAGVGVAASIVYGLTYIVVLGINTAWSMSLRPSAPPRQDASVPYQRAGELAFWKTGLVLLAVLLPFQIRIPTLTHALTINLADPIAFIVGGTFLVAAYYQFDWRKLWRQKLFWGALAGFVLLIAYGWLVGFLRFGSNDWATTNRLFGLLVLSSYLFSGAALTYLLGPGFFIKWGQTGAIVTVLTALTQFSLVGPLGNFGATYFNWTSGISGFYQDRNALSLLILVFISSILIPHGRKNSFVFQLIIPVILGYSIIFSGSRSGVLGLIVVLAFAFWKNRRPTSYIAGILTVGSIISMKVQDLLVSAGHITNPPLSFMGGRTVLSDSVTISQQRLDTWTSAIDMFSDHAILGGGLGAVVKKAPDVVHNVFLWIAAEMGLIGLLLLLPLFLVIGKEILKNGIFRMSTNSYLLLCLGIVFCGIGLVQDIAYQRIVWLMIGLLMASPAVKAANGK